MITSIIMLTYKTKMKTDKDYQINEENDTGEEHAKLVLSRLVQNPDKSVNEIIKDVVPTEINEMLRYALKRYVNETLNKESQHNQSSDGEENDGCYNCYDVVLMLDEQCPECGNGG